MGKDDDSLSEEHGDHRKKSSNRRRRREEQSKHDKRKDDDNASEDHSDDRRKKKNKHSRRRSERSLSPSESESDSEDDERDRKSRKKHRRKERRKSKKRTSSRRPKKHKKQKKSRKSSSSESSSDDDDDSIRSESSSSSNQADYQDKGKSNPKSVLNPRLVAKLQARGETLEERQARRGQKRAAYITAKFGYTPDENPFHDPNLHETFTWNKKKQKEAEKSKASSAATGNTGAATAKPSHVDTIQEIEKVRQRRLEREQQLEELERLRAEEARMKELENYDVWAQKEEAFHLQQQTQRSAIRLVEGREQPIDVLAKNLLLFGMSDKERAASQRASVKYREKYNALKALEDSALDAELEDPIALLKLLKLHELEELLIQIDAFRKLEREAALARADDTAEEEPDEKEDPGLGFEIDRSGDNGEPSTNAVPPSNHNYAGKGNIFDQNHVLLYWDNLRIIVLDEILHLKSGGKNGTHAKMAREMQIIFKGQSMEQLMDMQKDVREKISDRRTIRGTASQSGQTLELDADRQYWSSVEQQLTVHLAKMQLSDLHAKMIVRQLEKLENRKEERALAKQQRQEQEDKNEEARNEEENLPEHIEPGYGDQEEELGVSDEVETMKISKQYSWQDKYRPRKPRYFNRVKTGYDWNKYNQTHYDKDNPPPKTVQGYKFNIFYPDLIDPTQTPQFFLEAADSDEFCIIRFRAGPPYEDVAFKIINREWNRSRKRGYKCTFERGVLSLYFNFTTHWYRR